MGHAALKSKMSGDEYLAWEAEQTEKHDFIDGEVYAMAGAESGHVTTSLNMAMALRQHLAGTPCRTFIADMKVQAREGDNYFYPDVVVTCSDADRSSSLVKREPTLIIEVLSPSTAAYDLGEKFARYRSIASLKEIAFIDMRSRRTDVYRRGADGLWVLHPFDAGAAVTLASVELTVSAAIMFAEVDVLPTPASS
jgi:Uma2 family endonuclease